MAVTSVLFNGISAYSGILIYSNQRQLNPTVQQPCFDSTHHTCSLL